MKLNKCKEEKNYNLREQKRWDVNLDRVALLLQGCLEELLREKYTRDLLILLKGVWELLL